jgi:hypothetical protein
MIEVKPGPKDALLSVKLTNGREFLNMDAREMHLRATLREKLLFEHKDAIPSIFNTNTIDSNLQRVVVLQEALREFKKVLAPLTSFSTVFNNVPLEGTDEVVIPFYPLATDAGNSWDPSSGYETMGNTATEMRKIPVGGSGADSGSSAAANTAKDRKWVGLSFSSYLQNRQPFVSWVAHATQKANRLGVLIFTDIVSRCITTASFGTAVKAMPAAGFSADDIADLAETATGLNWPTDSRALTLDHTYNTPLLKDPAFKQYLAYGSTDPLRKGYVQQAYGFDSINVVPNLSTYSPAGENLRGWINHASALLVATSPVLPTPEVRALMSAYEVVVDSELGIALEYRRFGNVVLDSSNEVIECSYGAVLGRANALKRITSQ